MRALFKVLRFWGVEMKIAWFRRSPVERIRIVTTLFMVLLMGFFASLYYV